MATVSLAEIEADPKRYQRCSNGVIRDGVTNRFVRADQNTAAFTQATAKRANDIKRSIWEVNFNTGMAEVAAGDGGSQERAMQMIGSNIGKIAATNDGMPAVKAAAEVARLGGWVERRQGAAGTTVNIINVVEGAGAADLLREVRDIDVIDME